MRENLKINRIFKEFQHHALQTNIVNHFGGFFHQTKVHQPIGCKDFIQTVIRISTEAGGCIHFCMKRLRTLMSFKYSKLKYWYYSNADPIWQCCGSGSGRIRNFLPDPESRSGIIVTDPDPGSPDKIRNTVCPPNAHLK